MIVSVSGDANCNGRSKVCVIPSGETTSSNGWAFPANADDGRHNWRVTLQPAAADFSRRTVREQDPRGGIDGCYFQHSTIKQDAKVSGGNWTVLQNNILDKDDTVGWDSIAVGAYRNSGRAPCAARYNQQMLINCPQPIGDQVYRTNQLGGVIDRRSVTSLRDGQTATR
jgi:hypothetical protein